jgi:hypothetical protein
MSESFWIGLQMDHDAAKAKDALAKSVEEATVSRHEPRPRTPPAGGLAMTPDDFRNLALELPEALEASHHGHPDFRVRGKIFATIMPDGDHGMVKLSPDEQRAYVRSEPDVFQPVKGAWGRQGCTSVLLEAATKASVRRALALAWRGTAPKRLSERFEAP